MFSPVAHWSGSGAGHVHRNDAFDENYGTFDPFSPGKSTLELTFPAVCTSKILSFKPKNLDFSKFEH